MGYKGVLQNVIMQKGQLATADSLMMQNFVAPFSATAVVRLEAVGVNIVGTTTAGEFGAIGLFKKPKDGYFVSYSPLEKVADGSIDFALFNDYTGAISNIAASKGLFYIHPTYGSVSRYGLIPSVTSIDQIGIACKDPEVGFHILKIIAGYDSRDGVMEDKGTNPLFDKVKHKSHISQIKKAEYKSIYQSIFPQLKQIICCAELSNNISRYDGIKFGYRAKEYNGLQELYAKSRTGVFSEDVKLAAIIGAMVLSQENYTRYYNKAMRLRRLIKSTLSFDKYDVLEVKCPLLSRLCGLPSLATPDKLYIANAGCEETLEAICNGVSVNGVAEGDVL